MSLTSRASGRKRYLWTAFRPTWAGGNLLRWVAKGTQIPSPLRPAAWLFPAGKRREQSLRSGTAREVCSDNNSFPLRAPKPHHFHGWGKCIPKEARCPRSPCGPCFPPSPAAPATASMGDATAVPQPGAPAPVLLPTCQTPRSPRRWGWVINQCHMLSLSSHWKKKNALA